MRVSHSFETPLCAMHATHACALVCVCVSPQVSAVKTQQDSISTQMTALQTQVQQANTLAQQRANDNPIIDLINAGRQDIATGQVCAGERIHMKHVISEYCKRQSLRCWI